MEDESPKACRCVMTSFSKDVPKDAYRLNISQFLDGCWFAFWLSGSNLITIQGGE